MKKFNGFPAKTLYTPLPNIFYRVLLPEIDDITELKVTLYVLSALYQKRGYPRFITKGELLANVAVRQSLRGISENEERALSQALDMMTKRGTIICLSVESGIEDKIYLLNTDSDRQAAEKLKRGELSLPVVGGKGEKVPPLAVEPPAAQETPDIFTLYEENIGMLTPLIADALTEAEKLHPRQWIVDAIKEAASLNRRNWRYITRILERWSQEGKEGGTYQRYPEKKSDPDKYLRGKYGHIVRR